VLLSPRSTTLIRKFYLQWKLKQRKSHKERVLEFWACDIRGHSTCLLTRNDGHFELCEKALSLWLDALVSRTLLFPPRMSFLSSITQCNAEATIQRPPLQVIRIAAERQGVFDSCLDIRLPNKSSQIKHPSLANITSCRESLSRLSRSTITPGYYAGKGIEWLGNTTLMGIDNTIKSIRFRRHEGRLGRILSFLLCEGPDDERIESLSINLKASLLDEFNFLLELSRYVFIPNSLYAY